jgi:hypothetical protein
MPPSDLSCRSRAVRALVLLHGEHLRAFVETWQRARAASVALPLTKDPAYASLDTLARHVIGAARGYLTWICEVLNLADPEIRPVPDAATLSRDAEGYAEHVLDRWRLSLQDITDDRLDTPEYPSRWKTLYCVDAMLEHAVMHPIRHSFQLQELMRER